MDSLREAADKIKKSPQVVRKKIKNSLRKEKLTEDWIHNREQVELGVVFNVKILGRQDTTLSKGKGCTDKIVEELVLKNKAHAKNDKLKKASIMIDCDKVLMRDLVTHDLIEEIAVKRICFCTADPNYPKVLAFMVEEKGDVKAYIYALLTNKKAMADAIALTMAQAYTMSFEDENDDANGIEHLNSVGGGESQGKTDNSVLKVPTFSTGSPDDTSLYVDDDDEFLMLAQSRKRLDTGTVSKDQFNSNISDFLAVNNTLVDLEKSKSTDDLFANFSIDLAPPPTPAPTPTPTESSPPQEQQCGNLIQF